MEGLKLKLSESEKQLQIKSEVSNALKAKNDKLQKEIEHLN